MPSTARRRSAPGPGRSGRPGAGRTRPRTVRPSRPRTAAAGFRSLRRPRPGSALTTRAALLGLVVCTLVFSAVLPVRTFLQQRAEIAALEAEQAQARQRVAGLEHARAQLHDPEFLAAEARRRLNMAYPGEVSYTVLPRTRDAAADPAAEVPAGPEAPWWSQVWSSVLTADKGAAAEAAGAPPPAP